MTMAREGFRQRERLWLCGREVTVVDYRRHGSAPRIGSALVRRDGEVDTKDVPLWMLARDEAESVARANAIPIQLTGWESD
jgi:hypothetical protein